MRKMIMSLLAMTAVAMAPAASAQAMERAGPVVLLSRIVVKPGQEAAFQALIRRFYSEVRRDEPGVLTNIMYRPAAAPSTSGNAAFTPAKQRGFVFYEIYRDQTASRIHAHTPHFQRFITAATPLLAAPIELEFLTEVTRR